MASECRFFSFFSFVPSPGIQVHFEKSATHQNAYQSEDRAIPCRNAAFFVFFPSPAIQAHFAISATHQNASLKRNIPERNFFFFRPSFLKRWFLWCVSIHTQNLSRRGKCISIRKVHLFFFSPFSFRRLIMWCARCPKNVWAGWGYFHQLGWGYFHDDFHEKYRLFAHVLLKHLDGGNAHRGKSVAMIQSHVQFFFPPRGYIYIIRVSLAWMWNFVNVKRFVSFFFSGCYTYAVFIALFFGPRFFWTLSLER